MNSNHRHNGYSNARVIRAGFGVFAVVMMAVVYIYMYTTAFAAFNPEINYQGKLTGTTNVAVADDTYHMRFRLYTAETGGTLLHVEDRSNVAGNRVSITNGLFSVMVGSSSALTSVDFNQPMWLEVEVGGTASSSWETLTPRKRLGAVPAAFEAGKLDGIDSTQFVRSDEPSTIASSSLTTLLTITQSGTGDILNIIDGSTEVFTVLDGGNVGIGSTSPSARLSVGGSALFAGNATATNLAATGTLTVLGNTSLQAASTTALSVAGAVFDGAGSVGQNGYVLQTTGSGVTWVATSTLGLGGGGASTFLALTDTPSSFTANRIPFTNVGATALTDSANFVFTGTNLGIGSTTPSVELVISSTNPSFIVDDNDAASAQLEFVASGATAYIRSGIDSSDTAARFRVVRSGTTATNIANFDIYATTTYLNGFLGIGTTTPQSEIVVHDASGDSIVAISGSNSANRGLQLNLLDGSAAWSFVMDTNEDLVLREFRSGNDDFRIQNTVGTDLVFLDTSTGMLGIGTTTPSSVLTVAGTGLFSGNLQAANVTATGTLTVAGVATLQSALGVSGHTTLTTASTTNLSGNYLAFGQGGTTTISTAGVLTTPTLLSTNATTSMLGITGITANGVLYTNANGTVLSTTSLADNMVADNITVTNGTISGGNISGTLTTTGTLTIGDGGDRIDINSSGWDVTNSVFSGGTWQGSLIGTTYGGTGLSATPNDGELLIGDGLGYTLATLTAGSGINITNGTGAITITNSSTTQWTTSGANIYYTAGNVGVGTSSVASNRLTVDGNLLIAGNVTAANLTATGTLGVSGAVTLSSSLGVTSLATLLGGASTTDFSSNYLAVGQTGTTTIATNGTLTTPGLTVTNLTPGSLLFTGTGGLISQDNASLYFNDTTNALGVGSTSPHARLSIDTSTLGTTSAFMVGSSTRTLLTLTNTGALLLGTSTMSGSANATSTAFLMAGGSFFQQFASATVAIIGGVKDATNLDTARDVDVVGNYAYVVNQTDDSLRIIDISNPAAPVIVGGVKDAVNLDTPYGIKVVGRYAYVVNQTDDSLRIIDISNPAAPVIVGGVKDATNLDGVSKINVVGRYAYVVNYNDDSLRIIDISNPAAPVIVGGVKDASTLNGALSLTIAGNYAYITSFDDDSLRIIDISNPAAPVIVGGVKDATNLDAPTSVAVAGRYAYISTQNNNSLRIIDISNPAAPALSGGVRDTTQLNGSMAVVVRGKYAYTANATDDSLRIIDLGGVDSYAGNIGSLLTNIFETDSLRARNSFLTSLGIGQGGLYSNGAGTFSISATSSLVGTPALTALVNDTRTASIADALSITHSATGTIANGIGTGLLFNTEYAGTSDASTTATSTARIAALLTDVTASSPQSALVFYTKSGVTDPAERMRLSATGNLGIGSTSPMALLTVHANNGDTRTNLFVIGSTSGSGATTTLFSVSNSGTTTIANGVNILTGCYAVNGTCLSAGGGSGTVNSGTLGQLAYYAADGTAVSGNASLYFNGTTNNFGIGSTSPHARLSVDTSTLGTTSAFLIGSSTKTLFTVANNGFVGIGTASPTSGLVVTGNTAAANSINVGSVANGGYITFGPNAATSDGIQWGSNELGIYTSQSSGINFYTNSGANSIPELSITNGGSVGIGTTSPSAKLAVHDTSGAAGTNPLFVIASSTAAGTGTTTLLSILGNGNVGIGTSSPTSLLGMEKSAMSGNIIAGMNQYFNFQNSVASAVQYGDSTYIVNAPTTANTLVGKMIRIEDSTALVNTVRGLEVQAHRGTNTAGENTAISGFGRTFGVRGTTEGDAGAVFEPAGIYGETRGTIQGNAFRGYSGTITTANLASLYHDTSNFQGTGLEMNLGNTTGAFSSTTSRFLDLQKAGVSQFVVMHDGRVGIGTSTPNWGLTIASTTPYLAFSDTNAGTNQKNWLLGNHDGNFTIGTSSDSYSATTSILSINGSTGNVGIGTTSPQSIFAVQTGSTDKPLLVVSGSSTSGSLLHIENKSSSNWAGGASDALLKITGSSGGASSGNYAIRYAFNSGPSFSFAVQTDGTVLAPNDGYRFVGDVNTGISRPNAEDVLQLTTGAVARLTADASGRIGIGSTSPFATLSVISTSTANETNPLFWFATTSDMTGNNRPILWGFATTTGDLSRERVAIGTTSVWSATGGIRDSLTVDGRIYSTWLHMNCIAASGLGNTTVAADASGVCGDFAFDSNTDGTITRQDTYPPRVRISAGDTTSLAASEAAFIRSAALVAPATSSPVFEARVGIPTHGTAVVNSDRRHFIVGLADAPYGTTTYTALPTNGVFFTASSTANWAAVVRSQGATTTIVDTGIATTSGATSLNRFRIEVSSSSAIFLIDGVVVANVTPPGGMPIGPMAPMVGVYARLAVTTAAVHRIDVSYIQTWIDDPASDAPVGGETLAQFGSEQVPLDSSLNLVEKADIAEYYQVSSSTQYIPGMLVAARGARFGYVSHTESAYDAALMGAISTDAITTLGATDSGLVQVALAGRAPVIVSLENGPLNQGDAIVASPIPGVGMRATMPGTVIGYALEAVGTGSCDAELEEEFERAGVELSSNACVVRVLSTIEPGFSMNVPMFAEAATSTPSFATLAAELASSVYEQGALFTKFVIGQVTAQVAYIGALFADEVHTKTLCVADESGAETCISKDQLDALIISSGSTPAPPDETDGDETDEETDGTGNEGGGVDTEAPVIALIGGTTVNVTVGEAYADQGAVVSDNVDTSSAYTVALDGGAHQDSSALMFDTAAAGTHTIEFRAVDAAGNVGTATRTVEVLPAADPPPEDPPPEPTPEPEPQPEPTLEPPPADPAT